MKKKIKDLTPNEFIKICYSYRNSCEKCPFNHLENCRAIQCYINLKELLKNTDVSKILEQEIEVEDDE